MNSEKFHAPVLLDEVLTQVITANTKTVFDGTLGLGGHAEATLTKYPQIITYIATDLDEEHLTYAQNRLHGFEKKLELKHTNFSELKHHINAKHSRPLAILLDLGICSNHVDDATKGFSFAVDGPLKMSFSGEKSAEFFVNNATETELTKVFWEYGEIKHSQKIAQAIIETRAETPLTTTQELRTIIESVTVPPLRKKTLAQGFQAIRIHVNAELAVLEQTLNDSLSVMQSQDRLGIISYHSLEDRLVKKTFQRASRPLTAPDNFSLHSVIAEAEFTLLTKKAIAPSDKEIATNPRARSAKLRIIQKI